MEPLTWTGSMGGVLNPLLMIASVLFALSVIAMIVMSAVAQSVTLETNADGTVSAKTGMAGMTDLAVKAARLGASTVLGG